MEEKIERLKPDSKTGLTYEQVAKRQQENLVNYDTSVPTKSIKRILFENFFTLFNFLNLFLGIAIFCVGSYKNMLFMLIVILNTAISTIQEIHSKRVIDKLSVMASSKARTIRNGKKEDIPINDIVLDDILEFNTGSQIQTDSIILEGNVQVNESFITGEPDSISKKVGDMLLSGSYIVSGKCIAQVEHIGNDNYSATISSGAKHIKKVNSEIMTSLKKIIKILAYAIVPIGIALFYTQFYVQNESFTDAVVKTVAAVIGMIPEGLVLLTSTVLAVSVIRLSKSKVLVQELYCIETLARVDTLCLDKTGTLTEGIMEVKDFIPLFGTKEEMYNILANIAKDSEDENSTIQAMRSYFTNITTEFKAAQKIAFSSDTKWSGINFEQVGTCVIGAPEFVLKNSTNEYEDTIKEYSKDYRVLVLVQCHDNFDNNRLPNQLKIIGLILISDKVRKEANQTLEYFAKQGVDIKIISGDNPITVSKIAKQVGVKDYENYIDMSTIANDDEIKNIISKYTIFGRVSPIQKKSLIVALKESGKTVAMTGDGVNDILALKESDCSIAMANGSDATKNVSQLVLLDSNFASMPKVVAEGRRTINNIQRSASLFLVKTIYSTILALMFLFMQETYPFIPIQLSLISTVTIGIPSFILALEPNRERIRGHFLRNVIARALPTGLTVAINILVISLLHQNGWIPQEQYSTLCVIATGICGIILLFTLTKSRKSEDTKLPISPFRLALSIVLCIVFIIGLTSFGWFFNIASIAPMIHEIMITIVTSIITFSLLTFVFKKFLRLEK
ncbi:MAG: HAD-IC family P-type ATPase [Clostridia bacterium]|nr:HAD-IC family P-type ATPase [Clostridia bacterium]